MFFKQLIFRASFLLFIAILSSCADSEPEVVYALNPKANNSIVIIGNTFAERLQYYNYLEPLLYKSFPDQHMTVRNLGWSADEINRQSRPLNFPTQDELLTAYKADLILACYGLNEAFK